MLCFTDTAQTSASLVAVCSTRLHQRDNRQTTICCIPTISSVIFYCNKVWVILVCTVNTTTRFQADYSAYTVTCRTMRHIREAVYTDSYFRNLKYVFYLLQDKIYYPNIII